MSPLYAGDKFEGVMTYHTYHFSSNLVTDYAPKHASTNCTKKYNLPKIVFYTLLVIN